MSGFFPPHQKFINPSNVIHPAGNSTQISQARGWGRKNHFELAVLCLSKDCLFHPFPEKAMEQAI
jgi:hypothetical protein